MLGYRYTTVPSQGAPGVTHAANAWLYPLARSRGSAARFVRLGIGAELAFRRGPYDRLDGIYTAALALGAQYPLPFVTPFAQMVYQAGFATPARFDRTDVAAAQVLGAELGFDFRAHDFFGLAFTLGVGRTTVGDQWSNAAWVRVGFGLF